MPILDLEFTTRDLARTRFAISPLWEAVAAARILKRPEGHPLYLPWSGPARERLSAAGLDWGLLADLVPEPPRTIPVFVAPPPTTSVPDLRVELDALRATAPESVRAGLSGPRAPHSERVAALGADPVRGLAELADTVEAFWAVALAPLWPRLRALLEGDVLHRARTLARSAPRPFSTTSAPRSVGRARRSASGTGMRAAAGDWAGRGCCWCPRRSSGPRCSR
nr:hypothetical protein [Streptomyces sp. TLI_235]